MFGKRMFAGPSLTMGLGEDLDQKGLARFLPVTHWLILTILIYDDHSIPGAGLLSKFYCAEWRQERSKDFPESFAS